MFSVLSLKFCIKNRVSFECHIIIELYFTYVFVFAGGEVVGVILTVENGGNSIWDSFFSRSISSSEVIAKLKFMRNK